MLRLIEWPPKAILQLDPGIEHVLCADVPLPVNESQFVTVVIPEFGPDPIEGIFRIENCAVEIQHKTGEAHIHSLSAVLPGAQVPFVKVP